KMIKNTIVSLLIVVFIATVANAHLYGVWQSGSVAEFGTIDPTTGNTTMKLEFPGFNNWVPSNSAMNNFTSIFTFVLTYNQTGFLVSVNVATNKVIYFVSIQDNAVPYGLHYDSDVNSLKCVLKGSDNNTWLIGEMDPASASYDVYSELDGAFISAGLSPYTHSYFVVIASLNGENTTMFSFDTRSGQLTNSVVLGQPVNSMGGPFNLLYLPSLDILVGTVLLNDSSSEIGMDYAMIDTNSGVIKPLGFFPPSDNALVLSSAAHQNLIYTFGYFSSTQQLITLNVQTLSQSPVTESDILVSLGYFTNF
ncbi:hypothetical protein SAMD00019534_011340, partial [Acytostelium subglobosum LB1]|uniref:hypothetical protein n=1 Tax=Acytostelium subglobosum LB1 TaxID=1410327 RepID=UPI0006450C64